ncbi:MAG: hypothetical protein NC418_06230 [Muribaculaceae bacterium]|nr:hypothetical protein [Muribaculaceae bacterium]
METEETMLSEFADNVKANFAQLQELFKAYDLAKLGYDMQEQECKEAHNRVLAANEFFAAKDYTRMGIKAGDRVTDEIGSFCLSEDDWERYMKLCTAETAKAGITDENSYSLVDWTGIRGDARRKLVAFIIDILLPHELYIVFKPHELNIVQTDKLLSIIRPMVTKAA